MALEFKIETKIDGSGNPLYLTDKTGAYVVTDNEEGWGIPNVERGENALMAIVEKIVNDTANTFLAPITNQIVYNPVLTNDHETPFQFQMGNDGGHIQHFLMLPASSDGITSAAGNTIQENEYFYMITDSGVYQKQVGGTNLLIEDYSILIDTSNIYRPYQANCQKNWTPMLGVQEGKIYNEYAIARKNCNNEREVLIEGLELGYNVKHSNGLFYQGLQLVAEDVVVTQLEKYGL